MTIVLGVAGVVAALAAIGVVTFRRTIYCALSLVMNVAALAVIFLVLNAQFLFAVQLIIYAGAVMVLFVFIIALLSPEDEERASIRDPRLLGGLLGVVVLTAAVGILAHNHALDTTRGQLTGQTVGSCAGAPASQPCAADPYHTFSFTDQEVQARGQVQAVGIQLFTTFLLPFEITSLLLFVAAIGAVYLTRRRGSPRAMSRGGGPRGTSRGITP